MRWDRFITLCLVRPLLLAARRLPRTAHPRPLGEGQGEGVSASVLRAPCSLLHAPRSSLPILMYHSISDDLEAGVHPYYRLCTAPAVFARQMDWLAAHGYRGVDLETGLAERQSPVRGMKLVVITFDDAFQNVLTHAVPAMQKHGFTGTIFVPTAFIGDSRRQFAPFSPLPLGEGQGEGVSATPRPASRSMLPTARPCLTWTEIKQMHQAGFKFGSHTITHPKLADLDWNQIQSELSGSKAAIEDQLGVPVASFAHPYAYPEANRNYTQRLTALLKASGYQSCVTTRIGRAKREDNPYALKRLPINSADDDRLLAAKLEGAYDWLGNLQSFSKRVRRKSESVAN